MKLYAADAKRLVDERPLRVAKEIADAQLDNIERAIEVAVDKGDLSVKCSIPRSYVVEYVITERSEWAESPTVSAEGSIQPDQKLVADMILEELRAHGFTVVIQPDMDRFPNNHRFVPTEEYAEWRKKGVGIKSFMIPGILIISWSNPTAY